MTVCMRYRLRRYEVTVVTQWERRDDGWYYFDRRDGSVRRVASDGTSGIVAGQIDCPSRLRGLFRLIKYCPSK